MTVNNKRVFYVKYLAHEIYTEILKARQDFLGRATFEWLGWLGCQRTGRRRREQGGEGE